VGQELQLVSAIALLGDRSTLDGTIQGAVKNIALVPDQHLPRSRFKSALYVV
jgi:hypothetical protein